MKTVQSNLFGEQEAVYQKETILPLTGDFSHVHYSIAIPSHRRSETIGNKTLKFVKDHNLSPDIEVFCSDKRDADIYKTRIKEKIIVADTDNVRDKFNFVHNYYDEDTNVLIIEDDVTGILNKTEHSLDQIIKWGFEMCKQNDSRIFGIYPSANLMFMDNSVDIGFVYVVANLYGIRSKNNPKTDCVLNTKNDYERSAKYFTEYERNLRVNFLACKTNNYKNKGGMQDIKNRAEQETEASCALIEQYPNLYQENAKRKSGFMEIKSSRQYVKRFDIS